MRRSTSTITPDPQLLPHLLNIAFGNRGCLRGGRGPSRAAELDAVPGAQTEFVHVGRRHLVAGERKHADAAAVHAASDG